MSIESELLALKDDEGLIQPERVISWARNHPKSALYKAPQFCKWDTRKLAHEHLLWAARALIAIHVRFEDGDRRLVSLTLDRSREGGGYRDINDVLTDRTLTEIMLTDALNELNRVELKYDRLKKLKPVWKEVAKVRRGRAQRRGASHSAAKQA